MLKSTDKLASLQTLSWILQGVPWLLTLGLPCLRGSSYNTAHILGSFFLGMMSLLNWPLSLRREGLERTLAQAAAQSCQSSNIPRIFPARLGCTVWINGNMHFPSNCFCSWRWGCWQSGAPAPIYILQVLWLGSLGKQPLSNKVSGPLSSIPSFLQHARFLFFLVFFSPKAHPYRPPGGAQ